MKRKLLIVVSCFMCGFTALAQSTMEFAGPDKTILKNDNNTQEVDIGLPGDPNACYEWSSNDESSIVSDRNKSIITVNPTVTTRYILTKTSDEGIYQDDVWVIVKDKITILNVESKICCYNIGDRVLVSDFDITTSPPGYGYLANVSPMFLNSHWGGNGGTEELTFSIIYKGDTSTFDLPIAVYGIDDPTLLNPSVNLELLEIIQKIDTFKLFFKRIKDAIAEIKEISDLAYSFGAPSCSPQVSLSAEFDNLGTVLPTSIKSCCNGRCINGWRWTPGYTLSGSVGFECTIPTPIKLPIVGGLAFVVGIEAGGSIGPLDIEFYPKELVNALKHTGDYDCVGSAQVPINIFVNVSGALQIALINPKILSATGGVEGSLSKQWVWKIGQGGIGFDNITLTLSAFYNIQVISIASFKGSYTFYTKRLF